MNNYFEVIGVSSEGPAMEEVRINEGIHTKAINMTRSITPVKDLGATWKLYRYLRQEKPFIVHTHTPKAGTIGMLAARLAGVPHRWHTVAGLPLLEVSGLKRILLDMVEKFTYANATKVLPNSKGLETIILENGYTGIEKIQLIGHGSSNGINTEYFNSRQVSSQVKETLITSLGLPPDAYVFVFVGRLVKDKGINELVEAFAQVSKAHDRCALLLVGPREDELDPLDDETNRIIKSNDKIFEVGSQKDIRPFVAISDVLVHPSYREGFPNVVLQASAMGLACIVSDINGCNEIITHGVNGLIIKPKDVASLKNAIEHAMADPDGMREMARNGPALIGKKYSQEYIWNELLKAYQQLR
ncbi:MAG: glycosyltransferase family 4 protein [Flavobacteriaceae bacterium]|nr:glycosyltransferase family 4 protein [Flavobacteriaceae bacterium]